MLLLSNSLRFRFCGGTVRCTFIFIYLYINSDINTTEMNLNAKNLMLQCSCKQWDSIENYEHESFNVDPNSNYISALNFDLGAF